MNFDCSFYRWKNLASPMKMEFETDSLWSLIAKTWWSRDDNTPNWWVVLTLPALALKKQSKTVNSSIRSRKGFLNVSWRWQCTCSCDRTAYKSLSVLVWAPYILLRSEFNSKGQAQCPLHFCMLRSIRFRSIRPNKGLEIDCKIWWCLILVKWKKWKQNKYVLRQFETL